MGINHAVGMPPCPIETSYGWTAPNLGKIEVRPTIYFERGCHAHLPTLPKKSVIFENPTDSRKRALRKILELHRLQLPVVQQGDFDANRPRRDKIRPD